MLAVNLCITVFAGDRGDVAVAFDFLFGGGEIVAKAKAVHGAEFVVPGENRRFVVEIF